MKAHASQEGIILRRLSGHLCSPAAKANLIPGPRHAGTGVCFLKWVHDLRTVAAEGVKIIAGTFHLFH